MKAKRWRLWRAFSKTSFANPKFLVATGLLAVVAVARPLALDVVLSVRTMEGDIFVDTRIVGVDEELLLRRLDEGRVARITWEFRLSDQTRSLFDRRRTLPEEVLSRTIRRDPLDQRLYLVDDPPSAATGFVVEDREVFDRFLTLKNHYLGSGETDGDYEVRGRAHLAYRVLIPPLNLMDVGSENRATSAWVTVNPIKAFP